MAEWPVVPLADLVDKREISYGVVQPGSDQEGGVPIVRVKDLRGGRIDPTEPIRVATEIAEKHSRTKLRGGEVLMSIVGSVGEVAIVPTELAGWNVARAVAVLRPAGVSPEWLSLALRTGSVRAQIDSLLNTTVQATLNLVDLKRLLIPVPPEPERRAIAEVLGALDDKIAANQCAASASLDLADVLYLREERQVAESATIGSVARTILGGTPSRSRVDFWTDGTVPWLASGKANEWRIHEPTEWITEEALAKSAAKMLPTCSTVLAITGATLGQIARLEIEACGNQSLVGLWHPDPVANDWLYFALRQHIGELLKHATGAAQQHVNKAAVDGLSIPWPDIASLQAWGTRIRSLLDSCAAADRESLALARARDELLPLLMSGKIRVKDAEKSVEGVL